MMLKPQAGTLRRSLLLSFVVGILAGSLVLVTARAADAAAFYGPTVTGSVTACDTTCSAAGSGLGFALSCAVGAAYKVDGPYAYVRYSANCDRSALLAADMATEFGYLEHHLEFVGTTTPGGSTCIAVGDTITNTLDYGPNLTTPVTTGCQVAQVCLIWHNHAKFAPDTEADTCATLAMGAQPTAPVASTSCPKATSVGEPVVGEQRRKYLTSQDFMGRYVRETFTQTTTSGDGGSRWVLYSIHAAHTTGTMQIAPMDDQPPASSYGIQAETLATNWYDGTLTEAHLPTVGSEGFTHGNWWDPAPAGWVENEPIIGYGFYRTTASGADPAYALPQNLSTGKVGLTNPAVCSWYWGPKIADTTDSYDEPLTPNNLVGVTPDPPTPPDTTPPNGTSGSDPGCGFSLSSPSTWASAGMCAAVGVLGSIAKLLGKILTAITGLAADIAGAITGALAGILSDLFIPDDPPSFSDVSLTLPSGWVPSLPSLSDGTCGALTLPSVSTGFDGGHTASTTLLNTCDAPWPTVRTFTYNGLLALALVGLIRSAFRMVMKAVGMEVEQPSGGGDDD